MFLGEGSIKYKWWPTSEIPQFEPRTLYFFFSVSGYNGTPCLYISEFSPQILDLKFNVFTTTLT